MVASSPATGSTMFGMPCLKVGGKAWTEPGREALGYVGGAERRPGARTVRVVAGWCPSKVPPLVLVVRTMGPDTMLIVFLQVLGRCVRMVLRVLHVLRLLHLLGRSRPLRWRC
jgi:hypothetical protein